MWFKHKNFLVSALAVTLAVTLAGSGARAQTRPNVVLIVVDDLGYGELGCYGGKDIPTPNIDALASSGVKFTNGYVTAPFCAASRAALMTGRFQTRFGFEFNPIGAKNSTPGIGLPLSEKTIADRLRDTGYATALIGKWHLGGTAEYHPQRRGFDEFFGFLHEGHYYVPPPYRGTTTWLRRKALPSGSRGRWTSSDGRMVWSTHLGSHEPAYDADNPLLQSSQPVVEQANLTDVFTREACDFIQRHRSQPFFLYLAYNAVHSPMQAADDYMQKFMHIEDIQRRIFAAMLGHLDDSVGRVLAQLREQGIDDNTLVVFLSDNGGPTKELTSSNAPLSGGKGELREGGIRVPIIVSWKTRIAVGKVVDVPVASIDVSATALDIARAEAGAKPLDGQSLIPLLSGQASSLSDRPLFWRVGKKHAVRSGDWKLIRDEQTWQLYNLTHDIGEKSDLATQEPARVEQMSALWEQWNAQQIDPLWR